jgi:hypothetical protein
MCLSDRIGVIWNKFSATKKDCSAYAASLCQAAQPALRPLFSCLKNSD